MTGFTPADAAALLWFALCWAGYTACADHGSWRRHSISVAMNRERRARLVPASGPLHRRFDLGVLVP